jgi:hypothetical protein
MLGFEMFAYHGLHPKKEVFVLLRLPFERLRVIAASTQQRVELDPLVLQVLPLFLLWSMIAATVIMTIKHWIDLKSSLRNL